MSWHHHLFPCICVSISPGGLGGHWTQRPIHTVLSEYLQGTRRNSRHFGRWRRLLVLSHYWVAIVLFRWSKAGNKNRISNEEGLSLFAGKVKSFISQWKPSATIALVIVKATEKNRHRKQCYLGLVLLRRRQSKAREPSSLLPVNAVLFFLTIYIWLFCTFIQSESPSAYLTFLASISKIIYFRECLQCCQFCFHVKTKHKCLSKDTTRFVPDYAYYAKEREHNTKSTQCSTNCTLVDFKSPCVVLWKKVLRGINMALAEGIWEIKSFISTQHKVLPAFLLLVAYY